MKKDNNSLTNKLLKIGNPKFWGRNFNITLKNGSFKKGKLIRVNWNMKHGQVIGDCYLLENKAEIQINLEDVSGIELSEKQVSKSTHTKLEEKELNTATVNKHKKEFIGVDIIE